MRLLTAWARRREIRRGKGGPTLVDSAHSLLSYNPRHLAAFLALGGGAS
jgi:hypothetical protein